MVIKAVEWGHPRNLEVLRLAQADPNYWTLLRLGDKFGITKQRVSQILKANPDGWEKPKSHVLRKPRRCKACGSTFYWDNSYRNGYYCKVHRGKVRKK